MSDDFLDQLNLPILIIHGKKDSYISIKYSIAAAEKIAGSKFIELSNADHMLIFNYPNEISGIMKDFFASIYT